MPKKFILILGGARSGKSSFAQSLTKRLGKKVLFVATGESLDEEMTSRIEEHRKRRPRNWRTLEIATKVGKKLQGQIKDTDVILLDCLTLLVSNVVLSPSLRHSEGAQRSKNLEEIRSAKAEKQVMAEMEDLLDCIDKHGGNFIVVSNEVGLGLVPDNKLGRVYRDLLGKANYLLAQHAGEVYFMVSGIPVKIKG